MDWIERWLGWSPDGGDGSMEALIAIGLVAALIALARRRSAHRREADATRTPLQSS